MADSVEKGRREAGRDVSASLSMLTEYPLTHLKINQKFVRSMGNLGSEAVVIAIVSLGHAFGLKVVAEGVETGQQAQFVGALGCDEAQGYLDGHPARGAELLDRLARGDLVMAPQRGPCPLLNREQNFYVA